MDKKCTICKIEKNVKEFNKNKCKKDGLNTLCRECSKKRSNKYYKDNPTKHKANVYTRNKRVYQELYSKIYDILCNSSCVDCGNKDIRVLEFDHKPEYTKTSNISSMVRKQASWESILKEMEKCDVVCCNCHSIRTHTRSNNNRNKYYLKNL